MAEEFVLSAVLELKDRLTGGVKNARKSMNDLNSSAVGTARSLNAAGKAGMASMAELASSADKAKGKVKAVSDALTGMARERSIGINLRDNASGRLAGLQTRLTGLTGKAHDVLVNVRTAGGNALGSLKSGIGSMMSGAVPQAMGMMGIGMGIADTINTYKNFQAQMSTVQAISGATGDSLKRLTDKAKEMGATTQFSATEAGQAMEYMAMAGWSDQQMMAGISGIMNLAGASSESLARVSDIVTDALSAFGLKAEESGHFADVLAAATSKSNTNVSMMGETFKYVAPIAGAMKFSIEDTSLAIGLMANAGIKGSEAGTALRSTLTRLVKPPSDAAKALDALGIKAANADGSIKPLRQTLLDLRSKFKGMTAEQKAQAAASIAGQEAMSGFLAMMNESDENFAKLANAVDTANGAAEKMNLVKNDNLAGDVKALQSAWESLQLTIMEGGAGTGGGPAKGLRGFVTAIKEDVDLLKNSLEHGLDFSSVGKLGLNIVSQLYEKFKALDGVGSILAGGALAAGLYKIVSLSKKAVDAIGSLAGKGAGGAIGNTAGGGLGGVGQMTVNAATVVVNGKGSIGGVPEIPGGIGGSGTGAGGKAGKLGKLGRFGKIAAGGAVLQAAAIGLDYYDMTKTNEEASWGAGFKLSEAKKKAVETTNALNEAKSRGASAEEISLLQDKHRGAMAEMSQAQQYSDETEKYNTNRRNGVIGSAVGGLAGAALGTVIGGPVGTMIGSMAGSMAGEYVGQNFTEWSQELSTCNESVNQSFAAFRESAKTSTQEVGENFKGMFEVFGAGVENNMQWASDSVSNNFAYMQELAGQAGTAISQTMEQAGEWVKSEYQSVADSVSNNWEWIKSTASNLANSLATMFDGAIASIKSKFSELANSASEKLSSIKNAASNVVSNTGSWAYNNTIGRLGFATGTSYFRGVPAFATGTASFHRSALAQINEHGGELVQLPEGSRVYPTAETQQIINRSLQNGDLLGGIPSQIFVNSGSASNSNAGSQSAPTITITGNSFTIREEADIAKIAHALAEEFLLAQGNYAGV